MAISLVQFAAQTRSPMKKGVVQKVTNESEFLKRFMFIPVDGFSYEYNRQDTLGGVGFRGINESYTPDIGVINPQIERLAILGGAVQTDYQIVNKQGDVVRANAIAQKVRKVGLQYDLNVLKGDPAVNPKAFFGLNNRLVGSQVIDAGGTLTLALIDQTIDQTVGAGTQGKILVCNKYVRRRITALLRPQAIGAATTQEAAGSQQVTTYNDVPIVVLDEDGDENPILSETETYNGHANTTSLYCIRLGSDTDGEYVQGLIGGQMVDHLAVGLLGTYYLDIVEANIGLAVFHPRGATRLAGIA
jgi:hypothetical protein